MRNTTTEAKTATNGGSVSTTADLNNKLSNIRRAYDLLQFELLEYGEFGILQKVANMGASLSCLVMAVRQAQNGKTDDLNELNLDQLIDNLCELPIFIESLTKVVGGVAHLNNVIERETAE